MNNLTSNVIDDIFCSCSLKIVAGGQRATNIGFPSDHVHVWIDMSMEDMLGVKPIMATTGPQCPQAHFLPSRDAHNKKAWKQICKEKPLSQLCKLLEILLWLSQPNIKSNATRSCQDAPKLERKQQNNPDACAWGLFLSPPNGPKLASLSQLGAQCHSGI